jgi:RimJ/RimL family protein N-acetyltransferase
MSLGPTLETARLILRAPQQSDFAGFVAMGSEEETMRHLGGVKPPDAVWRQMATLTGSWALLGFSMFSVIEKQSGEWIGRLGPWQPGGEEGSWPGTEVGWGLRASAMGKGFAYEGAIAAIDWAFDTLGWDRVIHCIDKKNTPSIALALRLGSTLQREAVPLPPPFETSICDIYGQTKAQWRTRQR